MKLGRLTDSSAASSAPTSSSAPSPSASVAAAPTASSDDAGAKPGSAITKHAGNPDAAAPPIADAAPPSGALKPSAYLGSINVVGSTYDIDVVRAGIGAALGAATQCFATAKLDDAHPYFEYHVTASGQVTGVGIRGSYAGADQAMVTCAAARLAATHFTPNPKNVAETIIISLTVHYP